jgi:hypothetical protein
MSGPACFPAILSMAPDLLESSKALGRQYIGPPNLVSNLSSDSGWERVKVVSDN